ncbi:MAG: CBS domain-containing protein [Deltaproteobacteria bacterium]|nr:CBS domain-containing protein [Deltaproteobacteria bacterium]
MKSAEDLLNEKGAEVISVSKETTLFNATRVMVENNIGALLVREGSSFVGIWTERDLLCGVACEGLDLKTETIGDHMVTKLKSVTHTDNIFQILDKLIGLKLRHILVVKNGDYIGILSERDVTRAALFEKSEEYSKLNNMVSWDYYEDWKWKKK